MVIWVVVYVAMMGSLFSAGMGQTAPSAGMVGALGVVGILLLLFWVGILIPSIAVQVRRLHDINRSGWWLGGFYLVYAVYFVLIFGMLGAGMAAGMAGAAPDPSQAFGPLFVVTMIVGLGMFIYAIALLVFYCMPGTPGPNRYGPDPYATDNFEEVFG
jgi:uncharacterized membrane protein YhaH (DUF805 family)